jgi:hypothetical protein
MTDAFELCYFEGVVSAVPSNPQVYLVDGHAASGVSGGPMWFLADDGDAIITGVCISYNWPKDLPGLVGFCPLQVLLRNIEEMQTEPASESDGGKGAT